MSAATPRILVPWGGSSYNHTTDIMNRWKDAIAVGGVLEFEAGRVYRTTQLSLFKRNLSTDGDKTTAAGIEGNGSILKWVENNTPSAGQPLLYVSEAQFKGNSGFFIRNLTIDCGNNDIPTFANAGDPGKGLAGTGQTGFFESGSTDKACDYGLFLYAVEDYVIENVAVLRAKTAGVHVRGNNNFLANRILFRQVTSRFSDGDGWQFGWDATIGNDTQASRIKHIRLENCGSSGNKGIGYNIANTSGIQLINCEAEVNEEWNIFIHDTVSDIDIFGGYTERSQDDPTTVAKEGDNITNIGIESNGSGMSRTAVERLRLIGGRHIGRFRYDYSSSDDDYLIHTYGHTRQGFASGNLPTAGGTAPLISRYRRSVEQQILLDQIHPAYYEIPWYYRYYKNMVIGGTTVTSIDSWKTALLNTYNIVLVKWIEESYVDSMTMMTVTQTDLLNEAIADAKNVSIDGVGPCAMLAFEPGKVYRINAAVFRGVTDEGANMNERGGIVGIDGNGATLIPDDSEATGDAFVDLEICYIQPDRETDYYTFWMRDLNIDANLQFDAALRIKTCKWFHIRNVNVTGAKENGIYFWSEEGAGTYYGILTDCRSHHNGDATNAANGISLQSEPVAVIIHEPPAAPRASIGFVPLNNIGFYKCQVRTNRGHGLKLVKASAITFEDCMIAGNLDYEINAGMSYSLELFNCSVLSGRYGTGIKDIHLQYASEDYDLDYMGSTETLEGFMWGLHAFGGIFRNGRNIYGFDPPGVSHGAVWDVDEANQFNGTCFSVIHTDFNTGLNVSGLAIRFESTAPDNDLATTEGSDPP